MTNPQTTAESGTVMVTLSFQPFIPGNISSTREYLNALGDYYAACQPADQAAQADPVLGQLLNYRYWTQNRWGKNIIRSHDSNGKTLYQKLKGGMRYHCEPDEAFQIRDAVARIAPLTPYQLEIEIRPTEHCGGSIEIECRQNRISPFARTISLKPCPARHRAKATHPSNSVAAKG